MEEGARTRPRRDEACPVCGEPADRGQLVCLNCGARLALDYRRPSGWKAAATALAAVVLVAGAAFAVALAAVDDGAEDEIASEPAARTQPQERAERESGRGDGAARERREPSERRRRRSRERERGSAEPRATRRGGLLSWPARNAFTVIILSAEDGRSARAFARDAARRGVDAGVLEADRYSSLQPGFWYVFAGVHRSRAAAERAAARLGRSYAGAYPQLVNGAERR